MPANIAIPTNSEAIDASVMVRFLNRRSGMIGSSAFVSTRQKTRARTIAPPTMTAVCQDIQSYLSSAKVTQISSRQTAAVMKKAPAQSTLTLRLLCGRCSVFCSTTRAISAKGTPT